MRKKMLLAPVLFISCCLCLAACVTKEAPVETKAEPAKVEVKAPEPPPPPPKDPCQDQFDEAIQKSRKTMKSVVQSCGNLKIEANPMWDKNYDGTVHARIYDASGKLIKSEMKKP